MLHHARRLARLRLEPPHTRSFAHLFSPTPHLRRGATFALGGWLGGMGEMVEPEAIELLGEGSMRLTDLAWEGGLDALDATTFGPGRTVLLAGGCEVLAAVTSSGVITLRERCLSIRVRMNGI